MLDGAIHPETLYQLENSRTGRYLYDVDHPYSKWSSRRFFKLGRLWRNSVTTFVNISLNMTLFRLINLMLDFLRLY